MTGLEAFIIPALTGLGVASETAATVGTVANVAGTALAIGGTIAGYQGQKAAGKMEAANAERKANAERVVAQQKAEEERRKKEYLISKQRAAFGASGGGVGGSAAQVIADTEGQGLYNSELQLWQGEERAKGYEDQANAARFETKLAKSALPFSLGSTIIKGAVGLGKSGAFGGYGDTLIADDYDADSGWRTKTTKTSPYRYG